MRASARTAALAAALAFLALAAAPRANADSQFSEGAWRLELSGLGAVRSGSVNRDGDMFYALNLEYAFPITPRATLGLRLYPAFLYDGPDTVWGAGAGLSARVYLRSQTYDGWYAEIHSAPIVHSRKFLGNGSDFNFLSGGGIGYKFHNNLHAGFSYQHISNGGISDRNSGINLIGLNIGFTF